MSFEGVNGLLVNIYEEEVRRKVVNVLQQLGMCDCEMCREDVMALALNKLPPRYVVTTGGSVFSQFSMQSEQNQAEIMTALYLAARKVNDNPRHPKKPV